MQSEAKSVLLNALDDKESPLYLSKNVNAIIEYLRRRGFSVKKPFVKAVLQTRKTGYIGISNFSERKISEVSRSYDVKQAFWVCLHGDVVVLSRKKRYGSNVRMVLLLVEQISNYVFLEALYSTKFEFVKIAFDRVFDRCASLPLECQRLIFDSGIEVSSNRFRDWFSKLGIKINYVLKRNERVSRGSPLAEVTVRRFRKHLETYMLQNGRASNFKNVLVDIEKLMNSEALNVLGNISSSEALTHDPKYVSMLKFSSRIKKRRFFKEEMLISRNVKKYDIVRVKKFRKKDIFGKESYGILSSSFYVILDMIKNDSVSRFKVGSLFTLRPVYEGYFTFHELEFVNISLSCTRYYECVNFSGPYRVIGEEKLFKPPFSEHEFVMKKV